MACSYSDTFRLATSEGPFPWQVAFAEGPLPEVVAVPTGGGKTLGVVVPFLRDHREGRSGPTRLVYVLPMRTLVQQVASTVRQCVNRLAMQNHVDVVETLGGAVDDEWVRHPERPAIIIGTTDLLVSRMLLRGYASSPGRWPMSFALLHNDARWVLDEVQLFGASLPTTRQLHAFREGLGAYGPTEAVWMSATVPSRRLATVDRRAPQAAQILSLTDADRAHGDLGKRWRAKKQRVLTEEPMTAESLLERHAAVVAAHGPTALSLVIRNTVADAQELYRALAKSTHRDGPALLLLHSRFRPPDRQQAVDRLLELASSGGIVVATQVVEAGMDLDARLLVTDLCPWSSLVQRLGRLNRRGDADGACQAVVHVPADDAVETKLDGAPYALADLQASRALLEQLEELSPERLETVTPPDAPEDAAVLRLRDLHQLFDTTPSLEGQYTSVSRFVRDIDEVDVRMCWREGPPTPEEPSAHRDELCPVPVGSARQFHKARRLWRRHDVDGRWVPVQDRDIRPGLILRARADAGGYSSDEGWTGKGTRPVAPAEAAGEVKDGRATGDLDEADRPITLARHLLDARDAARQLTDGSAGAHLDDVQRKAVVEAAALHDVGKAHWVFQDAVRARNPDLPAGVLFAKSGVRGRLKYARKHFRHEVASVLGLSAAPEYGADELVRYLIGAHHGLVRLALPVWMGEGSDEAVTVAGLQDGDELPAVDLGDGRGLPATALRDLTDWAVADGGRWGVEARGLLGRLGPFRLAYLETLVRAADWSASRNPGEA